jgi:adenine deaminase
MLCSDDKHPDDLMEGHINQLCARAVAHGVPLFNVLRAACLNPVEHYGLRCGLMRTGDPADLIRLHDLVSFKVMETWIDGECVARDGRSLLPKSKSPRANQFRANPKQASDFAVPVASPLHSGKIRIIDAMTGAQLWNYDTGERVLSTPCIVDGWIYIGGSCGRFFAFH